MAHLLADASKRHREPPGASLSLLPDPSVRIRSQLSTLPEGNPADYDAIATRNKLSSSLVHGPISVLSHNSSSSGSKDSPSKNNSASGYVSGSTNNNHEPMPVAKSAAASVQSLPVKLEGKPPASSHPLTDVIGPSFTTSAQQSVHSLPVKLPEAAPPASSLPTKVLETPSPSAQQTKKPDPISTIDLQKMNSITNAQPKRSPVSVMEALYKQYNEFDDDSVPFDEKSNPWWQKETTTAGGISAMATLGSAASIPREITRQYGMQHNMIEPMEDIFEDEFTDLEYSATFHSSEYESIAAASSVNKQQQQRISPDPPTDISLRGKKDPKRIVRAKGKVLRRKRMDPEPSNSTRRNIPKPPLQTNKKKMHSQPTTSRTSRTSSWTPPPTLQQQIQHAQLRQQQLNKEFEKNPTLQQRIPTPEQLYADILREQEIINELQQKRQQRSDKHNPKRNIPSALSLSSSPRIPTPDELYADIFREPKILTELKQKQQQQQPITIKDSAVTAGEHGNLQPKSYDSQPDLSVVSSSSSSSSPLHASAASAASASSSSASSSSTSSSQKISSQLKLAQRQVKSSVNYVSEEESSSSSSSEGEGAVSALTFENAKEIKDDDESDESDSESSKLEQQGPTPSEHSTNEGSYYPMVEKEMNQDRSWFEAFCDNMGGIMLCFCCMAIWVLVTVLALTDWGRDFADSSGSSPTTTPVPTPVPTPVTSMTPAPAPTTNTSLTSPQENSLFDALPPFTRDAIRDNPNGPQGRAWQWLQEDGGSQLSDERMLQRYALVTLYYATNGDQWSFLGNHMWLSHDMSECIWYNAGIVCDPGTNWIEVLYLPSLSLQGTIPPEIAILTTLAELSLGTNPLLQGTIPTEIGALTSLEGLDLQQTSLSGSLPSEIGNLTELTWLTVASHGSGSNMLSNVTSTRQGSDVRGGLSSSIPTQMGRLVKMKNLRMEHNQFQGRIPSELENLLELETLVLSDNELTGTLSSSWTRMSNLRILQLDTNEGLTGTVPREWGIKWIQLERLWLHDTSLVGGIPPFLCFLNTDPGFMLDSLRVDCEEVTCDCNCWCA